MKDPVPLSSLPVFLTIAMIPFTFSIAKGIGYGFIAFVLLKPLTGKWREIHPLLAIVALLLAIFSDFKLQVNPTLATDSGPAYLRFLLPAR